MRKYLSKGFTLIELLIVIAVLGILAIAVLAAINPIEQINRSRDTGSRSDSEQLLTAIDRFYASSGYFPWQTGAEDTDGLPVTWGRVTEDYPTDSIDTALAKLSDKGAGTGELKEAFIQRVTGSTYNALRIFKGDLASDAVYLCFSPLSKAFQQEAEKRCADIPADSDYPTEACNSATTIAAGGCQRDTTANDCICLP